MSDSFIVGIVSLAFRLLTCPVCPVSGLIPSLSMVAISISFSGSWVWDCGNSLSLKLVWTVLCLLEIILQIQLTSVFISPLFSLLSKKKKYCMTAVISYPRLKPCEQSAAELWQHNCDFQHAGSPWLQRRDSQSYLCFRTHIKHNFLRSTKNHSRWFSEDEYISSNTPEALLLSKMYLQTKWVCFVSECNNLGR